MKLLLLTIFLVAMVIPVAFGQQFDKPGLLERFTIQTGGYDFEVSTVSNFDITDVEFDKDEKRLTFHIESSLENNLSEIQIPINLINGNFTFYLNEKEIFPKVQMNEKISFITVEFAGNGTKQLDVIGTTYLPEFSDIAPIVLATSLIAIIFLRKNKIINFH